MTTFEAVLAWLDAKARRRASSVREFDVGFAVRNADYPMAFDHNRLVVTAEADADQIAAASDLALADAGHRLIHVHRPTLEQADRVTSGLADRGYERFDELIMVLDRAPAARPGVVVEQIGMDERIEAATREWQRNQPADVARQLGQRIRTLLDAVESAVFLGVRDEDGLVVAHVDLYVDGVLAQIEELWTDDAARNRGYGSALVAEAVQRAGGINTFLIADVDDWPREMYARLGFVELGRFGVFSLAGQDR